LERGAVDIAQLVRESCQNQMAKVTDRNQGMALNGPEKTKPLQADELKLRMVLDNLLDNASKYSDAGAEICVSITDSPQEVRIAITDKGVGIRQKDKAKLFQKFTRLPNRLSTEVGGSGLGLYWAHKIIELHNGQINVDSVDGKGSTFTIVLPRR
jgi:signal transduction histidine kinase